MTTDYAPISIAMATFNGSRFINEQLLSLASQTKLPYELVICDDCSSDDTLSIIERFSRESPFPVRVFQNDKRLGYRKNFIKAATLCKSDLIAFCDQDDVWYRHKIETVVEHLSRPDVLLVHHSYDLIDAKGETFEKAADGPARVVQPLEEPPTWNNPPGFTMVFRAVLLRFNDVFPQSKCKADPQSVAGHDQWIGYLATSFGRTIHIRSPLAGYRQHDSNVFGKRRHSNDRRGELSLQVAAIDSFRACLEGSIDPPWPVDEAVHRNVAYAKRLKLRLEAIAAPKSWRRLSAYTQLILRGSYICGLWPLGKKTMIHDSILVLNLR